jgi:3-oxoadipate CoA-transferase, beta subunit
VSAPTREHLGREPLDRNEIAALVARDIPRGSYVNLGIGQPTLVADHLDPDSGVVLHTENGMLGMGPVATGDQIDHDLTNAGKIPVVELPGASYFHHADSFAMMRGGHLDVCVLGAFQVSATGDLANWHTGTPKLVRDCTYPLTGVGCVDRLYTDLAVFELGAAGAIVIETFGITYDELVDRLDVPLRRVGSLVQRNSA